MSWLPNPQITVGTAVYTGNAINAVIIRRGRGEIGVQTPAGGAQFSLLDTTQSGLGLEVGQTVSFTVDDSSGSPVQVFKGQVEEIGLRAEPTGGTPLFVWDVVASGPLARLSRRQVLPDGRPAEDDGERVAAAVAAGLAVSWEEFGPVAWSSVGTATTWATVDPLYDASLIDPGVYGLTALGSAAGGYQAIQVATEAAFSGQGMLYETADGYVAYADADRRPDNALAGYLEIPVASLATEGLSLSSRLQDIVNRMTVEYSGGAYTASDLTSIETYGVWEQSRQTILASAAAGSAVAESLVADLSDPSFALEGINVNLLSVGTALRDALLDVEPNDAVALTGIPAGVGFSEFTGFVEGLSLTVDRFRARLTLTVSASRLSVGFSRWGGLLDTLAWDDVDASVTWSDARSL